MFQTKPELAWEMTQAIDQKQTIRFRWVVGDELFGRKTELLDDIDSIGKLYLFEVPLDTHVWRQRPETYVPPWSGHGPVPTKERLVPHAPQSRTC